MSVHEPQPASGAGQRVDWTAMVLVAAKRRVRHLAVWSGTGTAGPICANRGTFPHFGYLHEFPGLPICTRCKAEVELLASAIRSAES